MTNKINGHAIQVHPLPMGYEWYCRQCPRSQGLEVGVHHMENALEHSVETGHETLYRQITRYLFNAGPVTVDVPHA